MTDFLGKCVTTSCGLLESSSGGSGTTLTANNKLLGVGDKQVGTTDATSLQFLTDNKVRAILDANGNFDVRDLRTSELDILPNQQFQVISGTATLSNFESTISTTSLTDQFKVSSEFTPDQIVATISEETSVLINSGSSSTFLCGVIDSIGNISTCPSFSITTGDIVKMTFVVAGGSLIVAPILNGVAQSGIVLTTNVDIPHSFYFTQIVGTLTITQSKVNNVELNGAVNLADNHNSGLVIREETKDYININTLDDTMTLQNVTDINNGSIQFNDNEILVTKELVGSQQSIVPEEAIVNQSTSCTLSGEVLTVTADEASSITIPLTPAFAVGDKFSIELTIDRQTATSGSVFFIGVGEFSSPPLNYIQPPNLVYPTNTYYATPSGFGGTFTPPGVWNVNPNYSAPSYSGIGTYQVRLVLDEDGSFRIYVDDVIKVSMTLTGANDFECFVFKPTQGTISFDTAYASMLSDGGIVIDGYAVASTFDTLLGLDPEGINTFKQVNTQGLIVGDENGIADPTLDNSIRFGQGGGIIDAEVLDLTANTRLRFSQSGVGEVASIDYANTKLDLENYHLETKRIDVGTFTQTSSTQGAVWDTLVNATAVGSVWTQTSTTLQARGITEAYNITRPTDFEFEIKSLSPQRHWIGISDSNVDTNLLSPNNQAFWFKISVPSGVEENFYRHYDTSSTFTDEIIDVGTTYSIGDKIKFQINSSNKIKLYLDTGSGYNLVSTAVYTITPGTNFYGRVHDTNALSGSASVDLQVTTYSVDFTNKANKISIYRNHDIQFEDEMKISRANADYITLEASNIDVQADISATGNVSCNALLFQSSLHPLVDTSKMLSIISPYTAQIVYNTEEGQGKFCFFNGTTWQVTAETYEAVNDTASTTLLKGQPVQVNQGGNDGGVIQILTNGSNAFAGIVCFQDVGATVRCAVAEHGTWEVLCDSGTYTVGDYLQTSSTGRARSTTGISSQTWAIILESVVLASPGYVLARLRIYPP
jgi:hypothetical protein